LARSGALKRYWSGINNAHARATLNNKQGRDTRKMLLNQTGKAIYKESNFKKHIEGKKGGKPIKKSDIRKAVKEIRAKKEKMLKAEYKELKKQGVKGLDSEKDFIKNNLKDDFDFQDIRELFNSP
jgi:parvulin-like peptidyl-prolyl isomerase